LERIDWTRDLHFQTRTTIDTLDYSGEGYNQGSKVVFAASGPKRRSLATSVSSSWRFPDCVLDPRIALPGVLVLQARKGFDLRELLASLESTFTQTSDSESIAMIVIVDDSEFAARSISNLLWVTFTRSNPAHDIDGVGAFTEHKHWGCRGPLVIDARVKPHHAPPLIEDRETSNKVDAMAARGGPLAKYL
jgi:4-hydroxy-3-polyprenylbenzoate decarboxylase